MIKKNSIYTQLLSFYLAWFLVIALIMIPIGFFLREYLHIGMGISQVFVLWSIIGLTQILSIGGVLYIAWRVLRPIKDLVNYCREIEGGVYQAHPIHTEYLSEEIAELAETIMTTTSSLTEKLDELNIANEQLEESMSLLKAIFEVDRVINSPYVNEINETITSSIVNNVKGTVLCSIWLYKQEKDDIVQEYYFAREENLPIASNYAFVEQVVRKVFNSEKTEIRDFDKEPELNLREELKGFLVTALPLKSRDGVIGVLNIWQRKAEQEDTHSDKHLQVLTTLATTVAMAMENKALAVKIINTERINKELEIARTIQTSLYNSDFDCCEGMFHVKAAPAYEVGGDYYTLMSLQGKCLLAIADISGKGIPAALMTVNLNARIRTYTERYQSPEVLLKKLNAVMYEELAQANMFFTALLASYDPSTRKLQYSNAGHCYPLIYRAQSRMIEELVLKGVMVGIAPEVEYSLNQLQLEEGDTIVFYTDGVIDSTNPSGERFGKERLCKVLEDSVYLNGDEIANAILKELREYSGNQSQMDDITLVVLKVS